MPGVHCIWEQEWACCIGIGGESWKQWLETETSYGQIEAWYEKKKFPRIYKKTQTKTCSNSGYIVWTGHLLWSGNSYSGGIEVPTYPCNLRSVVCPAYEIYWVKGSLNTEEVAKEWLVQPKIHTRTEIPPLKLPGIPGPHRLDAP